jgi:hypothetical protein
MGEEFIVRSEVFMNDGRKLHIAKIEKIVQKDEYVYINTESDSLGFSIHDFNKGGLRYIDFLKKGDIIIYARDYEKSFEGDKGEMELFVPIYKARLC